MTGKVGGAVSSDEIAAAVDRLRALGLRVAWPVLHCPFGGVDRFIVCGMPPREQRRPDLPGAVPGDDGGGFNF